MPLRPGMDRSRRVGVIFSFIVSFFPPDQLPVGSPALYVGPVVLGIVLFGGIPLIIHHVRRGTWATPPEVKLAVR
jgi:hypothetical protein